MTGDDSKTRKKIMSYATCVTNEKECSDKIVYLNSRAKRTYVHDTYEKTISRNSAAPMDSMCVRDLKRNRTSASLGRMPCESWRVHGLTSAGRARLEVHTRKRGRQKRDEDEEQERDDENRDDTVKTMPQRHTSTTQPQHKHFHVQTPLADLLGAR